jgi:hypothetical protein
MQVRGVSPSAVRNLVLHGPAASGLTPGSHTSPSQGGNPEAGERAYRATLRVDNLEPTHYEFASDHDTLCLIVPRNPAFLVMGHGPGWLMLSRISASKASALPLRSPTPDAPATSSPHKERWRSAQTPEVSAQAPCTPRHRIAFSEPRTDLCASDKIIKILRVAVHFVCSAALAERGRGARSSSASSWPPCDGRVPTRRARASLGPCRILLVADYWPTNLTLLEVGRRPYRRPPRAGARAGAPQAVP